MCCKGKKIFNFGDYFNKKKNINGYIEFRRVLLLFFLENDCILYQFVVYKFYFKRLYKDKLVQVLFDVCLNFNVKNKLLGLIFIE